MTEFTKPKDKKQFNENFQPIKPLLTANQAYHESSRCLFCHDAPCVTACPTGINIPMFIRQIYTNNIVGAAETIYESNYFGFSCGQICPTEVLCEGACVYNHQQMKPLEIGRLQSYATKAAIYKQQQFFNIAKATGKKVAIIGAGPAGISCACELRKNGHTVDIFEAKAKPSGLTVHGVAPYKITNEDVLEEMEYLHKQFKFNIHYNRVIGKKEINELEKNYDAIFLAIGLGANSQLQITGENLDNCVSAVPWIEEVRSKQQNAKIGNHVVVLGGGNTAMDAASESARMGASVTLIYRRSKKEMSGYEFEFDLAKKVGVKALFNVAPVAILGEKRVTAIKLIKTESTNSQLKAIEGSEFIINCDMVIKATGQEKMTDLLSEISGITLNKGCVEVNNVYQTKNPKYFAAGDMMNGGKEVVNAVAEGKLAAQGICQYLR